MQKERLKLQDGKGMLKFGYYRNSEEMDAGECWRGSLEMEPLV